MFVQGQIYIRRDLHAHFGGQAQGGVSTPTKYPIILLFTGEQGHQYGYRDGWTTDGLFLYTGEGQAGIMAFIRGNKAIKEHIVCGKDLHLFEYVERGRVRYIGQMITTGFQYREAPDRLGTLRRVIVFELIALAAFDAKAEYEVVDIDDTWNISLKNLRERALAASTSTQTSFERKQSVRQRSAAVRVYVLRRSTGICEGCNKPAPFTTEAGRPYLEPHHIRRLSDGGPDHPASVAALCPNCHRRAHHSKDKKEYNESLTSLIAKKEATLDDV